MLRDGETKDVTREGRHDAERADRQQRQPRRRASCRSSGVALGAAVAGHARSASMCRKARKGAVVQRVQPGSPAEAAGLQPGDVIVGVGNHAVTSPSEAAQGNAQCDERQGSRLGAACDPQRQVRVCRRDVGDQGKPGLSFTPRLRCVYRGRGQPCPPASGRGSYPGLTRRLLQARHFHIDLQRRERHRLGPA